MHGVHAILPVPDAQMACKEADACEKRVWQTPALTRCSASEAEKPGTGTDLGNFS